MLKLFRKNSSTIFLFCNGIHCLASFLELFLFICLTDLYVLFKKKKNFKKWTITALKGFWKSENKNLKLHWNFNYKSSKHLWKLPAVNKRSSFLHYDSNVIFYMKNILTVQNNWNCWKFHSCMLFSVHFKKICVF